MFHDAETQRVVKPCRKPQHPEPDGREQRHSPCTPVTIHQLSNSSLISTVFHRASTNSVQGRYLHIHCINWYTLLINQIKSIYFRNGGLENRNTG